MKTVVCRVCGFEGKNLISHIMNKHNMSSEEYKSRYSDAKIMEWTEEEKNELSKIQRNGASHWTVEHWIDKGYSREEAEEKVSELQKKNSSKSELKDKDIVINPEYWVEREGFSYEEAKKRVSKLQSERSQKSSKFTGHTHDEETRKRISRKMSEYISNSDEDWLDHFGSNSIRSDREASFFNCVDKYFDFKVKANVYILDDVNVDVYVPSKNKIIEFFGDFWHCNPDFFNEGDEHEVYGECVSDIWEDDEKRTEKLKNSGYDVLIIWENDWINNRENVINKVERFFNV